MKSDETECPFCAEIIKAKAKVCKHCGRDVMPVDSSPKALDPDQVSSLKAAADTYNFLARIHFTGFEESEKPRLFKLAEAAGFRPVQSGKISRSLAVLVYGGTPGQKKLADAKNFGIKILSFSEFIGMVSKDGVCY